jgi:hypothetical protein
VAEQQRVLMEGYRLLKDVQDKPVGAAHPIDAPRPAWPPPKPAPQHRPAAAAAPDVPHRDIRQSPSQRLFREPSRARDGFWVRLRRGLFGPGKPMVEDSRI